MIESLIEKHLAGFEANSILDVGPGYSNFSRVAARVTGARRITYLDYDTSVLTWQTKMCADSDLLTDTLMTPLDESISAKISQCYDLILLQEVLEHLTNAGEILQSLGQFLAPGGRMVITVPTKRSERWIKFLNPSYMRDERYGHVREFDERELRTLLADSGIYPIVLFPTQPHYFLSHTWLFLTRMKIEGSTGRVLTTDFRSYIWVRLTSYAKKLFLATGPGFWGRVFPRNYFVVAARVSK